MMATSLIIVIIVFIVFITALVMYVLLLSDKYDELKRDIDDLAKKTGYKKDSDWIKKQK